MSEVPSVPESISHKELKKFLDSYQHQFTNAQHQTTLFSQKQKAFEKLLITWSTLSKELLFELSNKNDYLVEGRNPKALIALGILEAPLHIAVQAQEPLIQNCKKVFNL